MPPIRGVLAITAVLLLTGCSGWGSQAELNRLNRMEPVGSPYTRYLAVEYRALANNLAQGRFLSSSDVRHFARKGQAAAEGMIVMPEVIEDWENGGNAAELIEGRHALITALETGGRDRAPDTAAIAQTRFDCWAAAHEMRGGGMSCKDEFKQALASLQTTVATTNSVPMQPAPVATGGNVDESFPAPITARARGETVPVQEAAFMVFFDWDKFNLSGGADQVLDSVASDINGRSDVQHIVINGYTDTSGSEQYNEKLSLRRARAVQKALIHRDIPAQKIRVEAHGEKDLRVLTPDNVREPQNRRAEITLE